VPECLDNISVDMVVRAAADLLDVDRPVRTPSPV
jgi:hypothetical protein